MKRSRDTTPANPSPDQAGLLIGVSVLTVLAALLIAYFTVGGTAPGAWRSSPGNALLGLNAMAWGFVFLLSYYFSHKNFVFRWFIWFCQNLSAPSGRKLALAWFAILSLTGAAMFLTGVGWL